MKTTLLLLCLALSSCTLPYTWDANPLDRPYDHLTVEDLHESNIQEITSNPGYRLAE